MSSSLATLSKWLLTIRGKALTPSTPPVNSPPPNPSGGGGYPVSPIGVPAETFAPESDGQRYAQNVWVVESPTKVSWTGHSRPTESGVIANPNHVEAGRRFTVPAGMTKVTFNGDLTVISNDPAAGAEPVTGSIRIWNARQLSPVVPLSAYRDENNNDATVAASLDVTMVDLFPGESIVLYVVAYSPAGGHIVFDNLIPTFAP